MNLSIKPFDKKKARLARVGAEDINKLDNDPELAAFWRQFRSEATFLLNRGHKSIRKIGEAFPTFYVDMWTASPLGFDSGRGTGGALIVRLWALLFYPTYRMCSGLVHEADHYEYLRSHGVLGRPRKEREEFAAKHKQDAELHALREEAAFLNRIAGHIPERTIIAVSPDRSIVHFKRDALEACGHYLHSITPSGNENADEAGAPSETTQHKTAGGLEEYTDDSVAAGDANLQTVAKALGIDLDNTAHKQGGIKFFFWT